MTSRKSSRSLPFCLILAWSSGCVSQARYDDLKGELDRASEGRDSGRRHAAQMEVLMAELKQRIEFAEGSLETERESLAQARFEHDVVTREREDARTMSDQLLVELDRIGGHLRSYAEDKALLDEQRAALAEELDAARTRLAALAADEHANQQRFRAARELTLALSGPLERKAVRLVLVDGEIAIQFPTAAAFRAASPVLSKDGAAALEKAASVLGPLEFRIEVEQPVEGPSNVERAESVRALLVEHGLVPERVTVASTSDETQPLAKPLGEASGEGAETETDDEQATAEPLAHGEDASDVELELRLRWPEASSQSLESG